MTDNSRRTGAALEAHYQFLKWLAPTVEKFPRTHKFTLGDRIHNIALDVLESLIEATYTRERVQHQRRANLGIEKLQPFPIQFPLSDVADSAAPLYVAAIGGRP